MAQFDYDALYCTQQSGVPVWRLATTQETVHQPELLNALKVLGSYGWEVCAVGDFGGDFRQEILLKRRLE
jgi:hypothetical protein